MNDEEADQFKLALKYLAYNLAGNTPLHHSYANKLSDFAFDVMNGKSVEQAEKDNNL